MLGRPTAHEIADLLKRLEVEHRLKVRHVAAALDVDRSKLYRQRTHDEYSSRELYWALRGLLAQAEEEGAVAGEGRLERRIPIQIRGEVGTGETLVLSDPPMGVALVPSSSVEDAGTCYVVIEQSDAMAPEIRPGARVLIEETHDYEDGDVLLVTIPERGTHLRRLATRRGKRVLVADNAAGSVPLDEVEVLGVAIETINPLRRRRRGLNGGH